ncbi:NRAMP family divalent metal transporter [Parapedobacter deserti]|uniref:NRAMP family divalent metal transporter n=1 Tax=Parapedobacter deserti TaxID=1912957 RepID=A0ABV7JNR9_9SPHI
MNRRTTRNSIVAAAFLVATSAVGPGFLTQTAVFTEQLLASFGFVILVTIILDIIAQLNIWRVIVVSQRRAQDIANDVFPGLGYILAGLIVFGGLAFNIGNIAGAGLGIEILTGLDPRLGAAVSCLLAIGIFMARHAAVAMDWLIKILGMLMIGLILYVAWKSNPPLGDVLRETVMPSRINFHAILTLVGGTVGGYITFAGAHRLIDAGVKGLSHVKSADRSAVSAIGLASVMRTVLFLAALGVVAHGVALDAANPAGSVFRIASGEIGHFVFGIVLWCAAISSVVGAAYTSVSFLKSLHPKLLRHEHRLIIGFILVSTATFTAIGKPVQVLIFAGAVNGLILPLALGVMLIAANKHAIVGTAYRHPRWLTALGIAVVASMAYIGVASVLAGLA